MFHMMIFHGYVNVYQRVKSMFFGGRKNTYVSMFHLFFVQSNTGNDEMGDVDGTRPVFARFKGRWRFFYSCL